MTLADQALEEIRRAGPINNMKLRERLACSRRGLYAAMANLLAAGKVRKVPDLRDMRRHVYAAT